MPFTIPNYDDAGFADQAEPDSIDFNILSTGIAGNGVISGCEVTAQGTPDMTVVVASGSVVVGGTQATVTSGNITITTADAINPRFDLITVNSSGVKAALAGTPSSNPVFPTPSNVIVLAAVFVPASSTSIDSGKITDKRIFVNTVAGGDLTGTYPNPSIGTSVITDANISGTAAITNSKLANSFVTINGSSVSLGGTATVSAAPSGSAGGDLSGTYPNPTIGTSKVTSAHILDGTIVDADISSNANITASKIAGTAVVQSEVDIANTASKIVKRDAGGTIAVTSVTATGTISAAALGGSLLSSSTPNSLSGAAAAGTEVTPSRQDHQHGTSGLITTSTSVTGTDISGTFPALSLTTTGVTAGTYTKVTADAKGRITTGATASISDLSAPSGSVSFGNQVLYNLANPVNDLDAANKTYVDGVAAGLDIRPSVRAATTTSITLSGTQTIDGVAVVVGNRVLVKNQGTASANGIYLVASGAWTRALDVDTDVEATAGMFTFVEEGTTNGDTGWVLTTNNPISLGTTSLSFTQFSAATAYSAGNGIDITGGTISAKVLANDGLKFTGTSLTVDTTYVPKKYITTITGGSTSFTVGHGLGTAVIAQIYDTASGALVDTDITHGTASPYNLTVGFTTAPGTAVYRVVVIG